MIYYVITCILGGWLVGMWILPRIHLYKYKKRLGLTRTRSWKFEGFRK